MKIILKKQECLYLDTGNNYMNIYLESIKNNSIKKMNISGNYLFYPNRTVLKPTNDNEKKCNVLFNILPNKDVKETIYVKKYILSKRKIKAVFDRVYTNKMIKSPDHLVFLTSLVHLQKMIYIYLSYEFGLSLSLNKEEHMKIWPTKINVELPKLITKKDDINQVIKIESLRKTGDKSYFGTCTSSIEGKTLISADAVIYML